ncbi:hypothetical protein [Alicyclobacillus sp.]|uniref:hypothetical protein n=1 Tax=Alicyclobacillus sp. TaxID=61169 RepID=UPI0025C598FB|nr:hypothetical protein [Alicyclobacillus sp.]MCL6517116.1 hypothetical protein [Alicyclobacillus sp.]
MSRTVKLVYFFLAVVTMVCFAAGSATLAQGRADWAAVLFVAAIAMTAAGFIAKGRILKRSR